MFIGIIYLIIFFGFFRYVFTLEDLDSVAPCLEHFLRCIAKPDFPWKVN